MSTLTQQTSLPLGTWQVDRLHSSVGFAVKHMGVSTFRGGFEDFDATLQVNEGGATLTGSGRVASVQTGEEALDAHLQSPEFFDAERHPEVRFTSVGLVPQPGEFAVEGELTIKGITRSVQLRGTISEATADPYGKLRVGVEVEATVDRTDFDMNWNAELPSGGAVLANDVTLTGHLELVLDA